MATINVRKETGKLYIDFRHNGVRYREHTPMRDTLCNRRKLKSLIDKIDAEITLGVFDYAKSFPNSRKAGLFSSSEQLKSESIRFMNFSHQWMLEMSPSWRVSYEQTVRYLVGTKLIKKFGECFVCDITKADILKFRAELLGANISDIEGPESKLSPSYVNRVVGLLCSILTEASSRFEFPNSTIEVKPLAVRKKSILPFSLNEVEKIINGASKTYTDYFIIRFLTGLRTSELHALRWAHINFSEKQIIVQESIVNGVVGNTKSQSSARVLQMTDITYAALTRIKLLGKSCEYVFNRNGKPLTQSYVTQSIWYPLLDDLNLTKIRPYQTRHTAATLWLSSGENPEWIARQLGHSNTQILFNTYSNFVPNLTRQDGREANKLFNQIEIKSCS
jgi:integrase